MRQAVGTVLALVMAACVSAAPAAPNSPAVPAASQPGTALASGELRIPAASTFDDPGFHDALMATGTMPAGIAGAAGRRLVLKLWDAGRPGQTCASQHPLSGCATVDWSDSEDRPHVPPGGVFTNSVSLQLASGVRTFYLSESGALANARDAFRPG